MAVLCRRVVVPNHQVESRDFETWVNPFTESASVQSFKWRKHPEKTIKWQRQVQLFCYMRNDI
ncbi:hypothetical protein BGZ60DRAFT_411762 [Tricladium varicosporioides]|nr:hypothetical protein BGZ60DRAFT_411762 [Hymenoscyphus varicosporioides]